MLATHHTSKNTDADNNSKHAGISPGGHMTCAAKDGAYVKEEDGCIFAPNAVLLYAVLLLPHAKLAMTMPAVRQIKVQQMCRELRSHESRK